jgi:uncharacterized protein involved in response to NO
MFPRGPQLILREMPAARVLRAYITAGLLFMLIPGTFLGVVNLIDVSAGENAAVVSSAWMQAHGHAQVFGWVGTFMLGIGFYSLALGGHHTSTRSAWICWGLWITGVSLRWVASVYLWQWRVLLPLSAVLELAAFVIFVSAVAGHRPAGESDRGFAGLDLWIKVVMSSVIGFGSTLIVNLVLAAWLAASGESPAIPHLADQRFLVLIAWGFLAPFVWGFSTKWLPVFLGLAPVRPRLLIASMAVNLMGVGLTLAGKTGLATWCFVLAAIGVPVALRVFEPAIAEPKTRGVHDSFPIFVRLAYVWLVIAAVMGVAAHTWDISGGIWGASRHAFTVGFISVMVFAIGQRVLPAFASAHTLWSPRLMFWALLLLVIGCTLRVSSEVLSYQHYAEWAWAVLPVSAIVEMVAFTGFAVNLTVTVYRT